MTSKMSDLYTMAGSVGDGAVPFGDQSKAQSRIVLEGVNNWLQRTVPQRPQFAGLVPVALGAVRLYRAQKYQESLYLAQSIAKILEYLGESVPVEDG
ncbi:hypothetical protein [Actinocorallia populi]|uniref:hypothetical protein n=1 Tax=Actinocorallia populi TaxID=2079200 RepID=UPI0013009F30|nr:hypothetical protein [Actinocorallia populi]